MEGARSSSDGVVHSCPDCGRRFLREDNLHRHVRNNVCRREDGPTQIVARCDSCDQNFTRRDNYERHLQRFHRGEVDGGFIFECGICPDMCHTLEEMRAHRDLHRQHALLQAAEDAIGRREGEEEGEFVNISSAHDDKCSRYR